MSAAHDTQAQDLHGAIMNLPCTPPADANINQRLSYKAGHRDARHAAAELALTALASRLQEKEGQPARVTSEMVSGQEAAVSEVEGICERLAALKGRLATLAAGSQAVQVPGWSPIDSAPKDGTVILLAWPGRTQQYSAMGWNRVHGRWMPDGREDSWIGADVPTHWQPICAPLQHLAGGELCK